MTKDKPVGQQRARMVNAQPDDGLGPNTDIGARLRALYGSVQDEGVPDHFLDLLEKLDSVERAQANSNEAKDGR